MSGIMEEFEEMESDAYNARDTSNAHDATGIMREYEVEVWSQAVKTAIQPGKEDPKNQSVT